MGEATLTGKEIDTIAGHVRSAEKTLAVIRTEHAPSELREVFAALSRACGLDLHRNMWSPNSDFGFAHFYSNGKMLVLLYIGGPRTELVSVSETDDVFVEDIEETIFSSNIQSSSIRDGL
ncbi:MAG: hypothetical protein MUE55_05460 [Thermoplasmata archaeon]|jgi:hypothetical protein|nr:hypothetical protein [Thermoplasmata archaeon]